MSFSDKLNLVGYIVSTLIFFECSTISADHEWQGNWFPMKPGASDPDLDLPNEIDSSTSYANRMKTMGIQDPQCDDAEFFISTSVFPSLLQYDICFSGAFIQLLQKNLAIDYDPKNISHHVRYLCLENRKVYEPNKDTEPIVREYTIPVEYTALHRCMNASISYDYNIPTFGTHRPLWPIYGEYSCVPVQRWVHNLEHGAIVAVYHPCVNKRQLDDFRKLVKSCLYRHIISPYELLGAERPFALIAWGRSLEMSVVDRELVIAFVRMNAKQGPEIVSRNGRYNSGIIESAKVVSDIDDNNLCPSM